MGKLSKKFDILAYISNKFKNYEKPILVGGSAVELYTRGTSRSMDIDLIGDRSKIVPILQKLNFKKDGRHFYKDQVDIEIVGDKLYGERSIFIKYNNKKLRVISVEDLIIDRLNSCKFWKDIYGCEQVKMLLSSYKNKLDWKYLRYRAKQEDVESDLHSIENFIF